MPIARTIVALAAKDLRIEIRSRASLSAAVVLALVAVVVVGLGSPPGARPRPEVIAPLLWVTTLHAALLIGDRLEAIDREDDARSWLWLSIEDRRAIFLGKLAACTALLAVVMAWTWASAIVLLDLRVGAAVPMLLALGAASALATSAVVVLAATLVASVAHRSLLLPIVTVPLLLPTSIANVSATRGLLTGDGGDPGPWIAILVTEALLFVGVGILSFELIGGPS